MLALGSRRRCAALTFWLPVTTWKAPSRHSCHTGDSSTVPSRRYVASTASNRRSTRSPRSSMVRFLRMQERYRPAGRLLAHDRGGELASVVGVSRVRETRTLAALDEAPMAIHPVRQVGAGLLPVDERRLIAPVSDTAHGADAAGTRRTRSSGGAPARRCESSRRCSCRPARPPRGCLRSLGPVR